LRPQARYDLKLRPIGAGRGSARHFGILGLPRLTSEACARFILTQLAHHFASLFSLLNKLHDIQAN
jgi:hypothetical protein